LDRILICSDCGGEFVFTAGEQLFFHDKQFMQDPKRCKPCKSRRSGLASAIVTSHSPAAAASSLSRTETRAECSNCGIQTTVLFKPTLGRSVLCRQCFQALNADPIQGKAGTEPDTLPRDTRDKFLTRRGRTAKGLSLTEFAEHLLVTTANLKAPRKGIEPKGEMNEKIIREDAQIARHRARSPLD
jgi:CxxC-x17-CxxC domain-containing protein